MSNTPAPATEGFTGTPSDQSPAILDTGGTDITTLFLSMAERHPDGADADYLRWHSLDHRPEQMRLPSFRASLRVVSTPECRGARAASTPAFDAIDHVMMYYFTGPSGLDEFNDLSVALRDAGRSPFILPPVQRAVCQVKDRIADPEARLGADVLPWMPTTGLYLLVESGAAAAPEVIDVDGVAGVWSSLCVASAFATTEPDQRVTLLYLNADPVATAERLRPVLQQRWQQHGIEPALAAPFFTLVPYEWERYLP